MKNYLDFLAYPNETCLLTTNEAWKFFNNGPTDKKQVNYAKITETRVPFNKNIIICDVKISDRKNEDEIYEKYPIYLYNLRRGLSFIMNDEIYSKRYVLNLQEETKEISKTPKIQPYGQKFIYRKKEIPKIDSTPIIFSEEHRENEPPSPIPKISSQKIIYRKKIKAEFSEFLDPCLENSPKILRKGMHKFFDISPDWFKVGKFVEIPNFENKPANYIFFPIKKFIETSPDAKIELIASRKINGENAQISYCEEYNFWCIASKNVALCARNIEDIKLYEGKRYTFAKEMAKTWFSILSSIEKNNQLSEFIKEISNKTLIGEYVGNFEHQHMVHYPKETIIFFSIVLNESKINCLDPIFSQKLFMKYGLECVEIESKGIFNNLENIFTKCSQIINEIAIESIYNEEEGIVLYFVTRANSTLASITLSLCKIKTLEYRIYRKIRENIKNQLINSISIFDGRNE